MNTSKLTTKPLYILAQKKELPDVQFMDLETLKWIEGESRHIIKNNKCVYVRMFKKDLSVIDKFLPRDTWYLNKKLISSLHGKQHTVRVLVFTHLLTKLSDKKTSDINYIIAMIHDIRRMSDRSDSGHGEKASIWFNKNINLFIDKFNIKKDDIDEISFCVSNHDLPYNKIDVPKKYIKSLDIIKAADALDRFIQPNKKWWPNPDYIRTNKFKELICQGREITLLSSNYILKGMLAKEAVFKAVLDTCNIKTDNDKIKIT